MSVHLSAGACGCKIFSLSALFFRELSGVNGMTGATAETTTYDRIFSTMKSIEAIMTARGLADPTKVTATMLAEACKMVSTTLPLGYYVVLGLEWGLLLFSLFTSV